MPAKEEEKKNRIPTEDQKTELLQVLVTPRMKEDLQLRAYQESEPGVKVHVTTIIRRAIRHYLERVGVRA